MMRRWVSPSARRKGKLLRRTPTGLLFLYDVRMAKLLLQVADDVAPESWNTVAELEIVTEDDFGNVLWLPVGEEGTDFINSQQVVFEGVPSDIASATKNVISLATFPRVRKTAQALSADGGVSNILLGTYTYPARSIVLTGDRARWW